MKLYQMLAQTLAARLHCEKAGNTEWKVSHEIRIQKLCHKFLPSGSGFDNGSKFDFLDSKDNRLVIHTAFHHMDDAGYYDGWTLHQVIVTPSLGFGINLRITGRDRNQIKELICDCFHTCLNQDVDEPLFQYDPATEGK